MSNTSSGDSLSRQPLYKTGQRVRVALNYGALAGIEATVIDSDPYRAVGRGIVTYLYWLRLDNGERIRVAEQQIARAVSVSDEVGHVLETWYGSDEAFRVVGQTSPNRVLFTIDNDGRMTLGKGVTPDEAAREFVELVNAHAKAATEIVRAVSGYDATYCGTELGHECAFSAAERARTGGQDFGCHLATRGEVDLTRYTLVHGPQCPVTMARALLGIKQR
jgi:hypothetical protein